MGIINVSGPLPGPKSKELIEKWHANEADVTGFQAPVVWDHAKGCTVTDADGNTYIDWTSGVLVTNVGHCHPKLVEAAQKASARLLNNYECPNVERVKGGRETRRRAAVASGSLLLPEHRQRSHRRRRASDEAQDRPVRGP